MSQAGKPLTSVGNRRDRRLEPADGIFAVGLALLLGYATWLGRDLSFFSDDWPIIAFHHNGDYLTPYGGHLLLVPIAIYHTLFITVGLSSYTPYRIVGLVGYGAFAVLFYLYLRRRVQPALAAVAALLIVWYSTAQLNVLFPLLLNFSIPMAAIVAIWMLLDRNNVRFDIAAGACLAIALADGGVGLVTAAAVGTELLILRVPLRRWVPFVLPFGLWCLWYIGYHAPVANPNGVGETLRFSLHEIQATFAGFSGGWDPGGYVLLAATVVVLALAIVRWHTFNARATASLAAIAAFAGLTGYTARRGSLPAIPADTPRYLWLNAFFLVVALVEVIRRPRHSPLVAIVGSLLVVVAAITLVGNLQTYHREVVQYKHSTRTFMVATEAIPDRIDRHRIMPFSYNIVRAGDYLAAVKHLGSPLEGVGYRDLGTEADRRTADGWMIHDLRLMLIRGSASATSGCSSEPMAERRDFRARGNATIVVVAGSASAEVSLRRLARGFSAPIGQVAARNVAILHLPADHSRFPWHLRLNGTGATASRCR